jgi:hypothetical protein
VNTFIALSFLSLRGTKNDTPMNGKRSANHHFRRMLFALIVVPSVL